MGLLLGASVLTIFEVLDLAIYNGFRKSCGAGKKNFSKKPPNEKDAEQAVAIGTGNHTTGTTIGNNANNAATYT